MSRARLSILGAIVLVLVAIWWLWPRSIGPEGARSGWLGTLGLDTPHEVRTGTPPPPLPRHSAVPGEEVLAKDGNLQNAIVRVVKGADGTYAAPTTPAVIAQESCMYRPRVQAVVAGQDITIRSMDDTTHNVHTYLGDQSLFNRAENKGEFTKKASDFRTSNGIVTFKCDIHPWMTGYVLISPNPYFAVTGEDGVATLSLPAGKYTLETWQEKFGTHDVDVSVVPGEVSEATVEYDSQRP